MKIEIKHRWTGTIIFSLETESWKLAVEEAVESGADLSGADLSGGDSLRSANLQGADLRSADLQGSDLQGADLQGADLRNADLRSADLRNADLWSANLQNADLRNADLRNANLGADLRNANLRNADLQGANLRSADLRNAALQGAKFQDESVLSGKYIQIGPIGSRSDTLTAFGTNKGIYLQTGCFVGTVKDFEFRLTATHKGNRFAEEYKAALVFINTFFSA